MVKVCCSMVTISIPSLCLSECIHSFISGMHQYDCIVPNTDIILQSGQFCQMLHSGRGEVQ